MQASYVAGTEQRMPLTMIRPGKNPRRYFDHEQMQELEASIREKGVIQPIVLRSTDEGFFEIIAGERRFRASLSVFGEAGDIPFLLRNSSDEDAEEISLIENTHRADMSPTEEAVHMGKIFKRCNGDKEETAKRLGIPVSTLNRRLALLSLLPEVMNALDERKILLGHAELLATIPPDKQVSALNNIIDHSLTVQVVKEKLAKLSQKLNVAIFELSSCASCACNSSQQSSLFAETIGEGYCTNSSCFEGKTKAHLEEIRTKLEEDVPTVKIIDINEQPMVKLSTKGNLGIGEEQMKACRSCANFGCTVSSLPGSLGEVEKDICFDPNCHTSKVAEHITATKEAKKASAKNSERVVKPKITSADASIEGTEINADESKNLVKNLMKK